MQRLDEIEQSGATEYRHEEAAVPAVLPGDHLQALIGELARESESNRRRFKVWQRAVLGMTAGVLGISLLWVLAAARGWARPDNIGMLFLLFTLVGPATGLYMLSTGRHRRLARAVAACDDLQALGPLIGSLNLPGNRLQRDVAEAVTRMLPRIDGAAAARLTVGEVDSLNFQLRRAALDPLSYSNGHDGFEGVVMIAGVRRTRYTAGQNRFYALLRAIIETSPLFGNCETLRNLERLARMKVRSPRRVDLASAARDAADLLRGRIERNSVAEHLLRPAMDVDSAALLRPAASATDTDESRLLRPSEELG